MLSWQPPPRFRLTPQLPLRGMECNRCARRVRWAGIVCVKPRSVDQAPPRCPAIRKFLSARQQLLPWGVGGGNTAPFRKGGRIRDAASLPPVLQPVELPGGGPGYDGQGPEGRGMSGLPQSLSRIQPRTSLSSRFRMLIMLDPTP